MSSASFRRYCQVFFLSTCLAALTLMTSFLLPLQPPCHLLILVLLLLYPSLLRLPLNRPPLSGDSAETKCFLVSLCRWDCNKACRQEAWVALSHALCLPSLTPSSISLHCPTSHRHSPPGLCAFIFTLSLLCLFFSILSCSYSTLHSLTCVSCPCSSLVSLPTALSG